MAKYGIHEDIVVCLFDGNYDLGIAALINSLVKADFNGLVCVGYRGRLPVWINQFKSNIDNTFHITEQISLYFHAVNTHMHLGYFKPHFLKHCIETYRSTKKFFYFDADITVNAPWKVFSKWLEKGACLCLDNNFQFIHNTHPWRKDWRKLMVLDSKEYNNINYYFNSGFIGLERESVALLDRWIYFTDKYIEMGGNTDSFVKEAHSSFKGDQDLLNASITTSPDLHINIMGTEGMGFTHPATLMAHAIGEVKPWNKNFLTFLIKFGHKPNLAEKSFFTFCKFPIQLFPRYKYLFKRLNILVASILGRVLR